MSFKKELRIWGTFIKSFFVCVHLPGDLTVIRLTEKLEDLPDDIFPCETWMTRSLCKCGETVDQKFAFGVDHKNRTFNDDGIRIEDVK